MIYGIAVTLDTTNFTTDKETKNSPSKDGKGWPYSHFSDTNRYVSLKLMRKGTTKDTSKYIVIDSLSFDSHGMPPLVKKTFFQYSVEEGTISDFAKNTEGTTPKRTCYELYFDSVHTLADTFFISFSDYPVVIQGSASQHLNPRCYFAHQLHYKNGAIEPNYFCEILLRSVASFDGNYYDYGEDYFPQIGYSIYFTPWGMIFPIVKLRCRGGVKGMDLYDKGKGYARVVWNFNEWDNLNRYEVRLDTVNTLTGDTVEVYHGFVDDTLALFTGLAEGQAYRCSVRKGCRYATTSYDTTLWSDTWQHVEFATDIYGISQPDGTDFSLSPNPASGTARLTLPRPIDEDATVVLRDLCGRTLATAVLPRGATELAIPLAGLAPSAYLVQLTTPTALSTRRLVVR